MPHFQCLITVWNWRKVWTWSGLNFELWMLNLINLELKSWYLFVDRRSQEWANRGRGRLTIQFYVAYYVLKWIVFRNQMSRNLSVLPKPDYLTSCSLCIKASWPLTLLQPVHEAFLSHYQQSIWQLLQMWPQNQAAVLCWAEQDKLTVRRSSAEEAAILCNADSVEQLDHSELLQVAIQFLLQRLLLLSILTSCLWCSLLDLWCFFNIPNERILYGYW